MEYTSDIIRVRVWWDDRPGVSPGWYGECWREGGTPDDELDEEGRKVWHPVNCDSYRRDQVAELTAALHDAFSPAEIEVIP